MRTLRRLALSILVVLVVGPLARSEEADLSQADALFEAKNYAEASQAYQALLSGTEDGETARHASRRIVVCNVRMERFDAALDQAEARVERWKGTPWEARAHRFAGNLWLNVPHWGTRAGGVFHRDEWMQGIHLQSFGYDKRHAVSHLEAARNLYATFEAPERRAELVAAVGQDAAKNWRNERLEALFDLAGACARFGIYENQWSFWWRSWAERDDAAAETAGADDFDESDGEWEMRRERPIGLRLGEDGAPVFPTKPDAWSSDLDDDAKLLWLLDEIRGLDPTETKRYAGLASYRQAMLARARFGVDRITQIAGIYWSNDKFPLQEDLKAFQAWELEDDQSIVLAGGRIQVVTLPPAWSVLALLRDVQTTYEGSDSVPQALYATGVVHQSRQQYVEALADYRRLVASGAEATWKEKATTQIGRIEQAGVHINQTGLQLPGEGAALQISYRNTSKLHFRAYAIDLEGFLRTLRDQPFDTFEGPKDLWALSNWHGWFTQGYNERSFARRAARKHVGAEVATWTADVEDDGTHRLAETTIDTPLGDRAGTYLVVAFSSPPPETAPGANLLAIGHARAVVGLTDLAFVQKPAEAGRLTLVADARTGAPIEGAVLEVTEFWSVWDQKIRKSRHYRESHTLTTDAEGLVLDPRPEGRQTGQVHVLVRHGEGDGRRLAWSGMEYWNHYNPSAMESGLYAYCITDRPVYRPGQLVRFKTWLRQKRHGLFETPAGRAWRARIYDPRGNEVFQTHGQADGHGGFDGEFRLGEEPSLGMYRLVIDGAQRQGAQGFRVEEYKKPEFEVTVAPSTTHAKLGDTVEAKIEAKYYFGAPVTDAEVSYKVFREEYRHAVYPGGAWSWLYGPGYGLPWYGYDFFPWWGEMRCCHVPPAWWWGFFGYRGRSWPGANPVRELVAESEGRIGEDGTLTVEIDTSAALRDHGDLDHRYVVEAEVRDASRRVIKGAGSVTVTRQAFYAVVEGDRGWYRPGEEMVLRVRCTTPGGAPVAVRGMVTVEEVSFGRTGERRLQTTPLDRFPLETDARGMAEIRVRHERSGRLQIAFEAPDAWGGTVRGHGLIWVCGEDFDGSFHRFNDLELITDRRTYAVGDTAHVMVSTARANSWVLFGDEVDQSTLRSWKLLHIPGRSIVVDVPIEAGDVPNLFVEATTVSDLRVHQQMQRICVPPTEGMLDVSITTDRPEYGPGDTATVTVKATQPDGSPAQAQVVVSAFDRSVLYIQGELTPSIAGFFHGTLRQHATQMSTNVNEIFSSAGHVFRPSDTLYPLPPSWWGVWGPMVGDWRVANDRDMALFGALDEDGEGHGDMGGGGLGLSGDSTVTADASAPAPCAPPSGPAGAVSGSPRRALEARAAGDKEDGGRAAEAPLVEAEVRTTFADTAVWLTALDTGTTGEVTTTVEMPENLTTWKVNAWGVTQADRVGQSSTSCVTTKNLIVRLQAPRFFVETDEVVLSANVHNYLDTAKRARVELTVPAEFMTLVGETPAVLDVDVEAGGERRVDWRVQVTGEGVARIRATAQTDEESDAIEMAFPVLVHGMQKQVATTGSLRPDDLEGELVVALDVPQKRRPEFTRLEVVYAPSLVGTMLDALPYCLEYPYGCTEQTISRFLPAVLVRKTLQDMGLSLGDLQTIREGRMAELRRIRAAEGVMAAAYADSPIFDQAEMDAIIAKGLSRIAKMQQGDGGWGWWTRDTSSPYLSAYVLHGLLSARAADVAVDDGMIQRGVNYLSSWAQRELRKTTWSVGEMHAFVAYVLAAAGAEATIEPEEEDTRPARLLDRLWEGRDLLNLYGKSLLSLAQADHGEDERARTTLRNVLQYVQQNEETQVAWLDAPRSGWWYWWNNDVETNAWALRALVRLDPKSDLAPRIVKWLLNNRRNGYYWRSTRDTTLCVAAMSAFVRASGEGAPDFTVRLDLDDGAVVKEVRVTKENFFTFDNRFVVEGTALSGGSHTLKITKTGQGALYVNTYLSYFTKEDHITAAGHELEVERTYFHLKRIPYEVEVMGSEGQPVMEQRLRYERVPLENGDTVESGDLVQVELRVISDNDYTYLCLEDMKPAGCEATEVRSGGDGQEGFWAYRELRDEKVVFFLGSLSQGEHLLRYRLRAEVPGVFHALPAKLFAMYVPELRANAEEMKLEIDDR